MKTKIKSPERCLVCGAEWQGGCCLPNTEMLENARVLYKCGGSISVTVLRDGVYQILLKCEKE